ncbi:HNH endonuclease [Candidatus Pacearchaeota archaeon]|nr:HNH endonuclease [Candidatus Pacearchaeota archaeon]
MSICNYCGKKINIKYPSWKRKYHEECYLKIRKGKCTNTGRTQFKKGIKPWNYIDGKSKERYKDFNKWKEIAKKCYKRDNYTCQLCEKKGGILNAHHKIPYSISKNNNLNNLITLCVSCHAKVHHNFKEINKIRIKKSQEVSQ